MKKSTVKIEGRKCPVCEAQTNSGKKTKKIKLLIVAIAFMAILLLASCTPSSQTQDTTEPHVSVDDPISTEPPETSAPEPEINYKEIECTHIDKWKDIGIKWRGNDFVFVTKFPEDWELSKLEGEEDSTYVILRNGVDIGVISTVAPKEFVKNLESSFHEIGEIELYSYVRMLKQGKHDVYSRVFVIFHGDFRVFFEIDYNEIDDENIQYMVNSIAEGDEKGGVVRIPMEGGNSSRRTIVIGNSFIRTSQIGDYLNHFYSLGNKYYTLERFTRNGQSVEDYAKESWLKEFRNGTYHVVFLCGLYNVRDVDNFPKVVEACKQSNTKLVVFPAHNENPVHSVTILEQYPDVYYLSWRDEIDLFIDNGGVDYYDFCINDGDKHSKPLAGYIGAHMIYCALYGEVPPTYTAPNPHSISYIESMLGEEYIKTGVAPGERTYTVYEIVD